MSFYTSLSGLKAAQSDLGVISNNVANVNTTSFKKSKTSFGDIFASAPSQNTRQIAGQGVRVLGTNQQFVQGTVEETGKTLDMAITGDGFFTVRAVTGTGASASTSYTRNGAFTVDKDRYVIDTTGARLQVFAVDPATGVQATTMSDLQIPSTKPGDPTIALSSITISEKGVVAATYADASTLPIGSIVMASFASQENLRQKGDAHWEASLNSGDAVYGVGGEGQYGFIRSGSLERSNVDITEELVALIAAQRNFQANAKAIETSTAITQTIINLRT